MNIEEDMNLKNLMMKELIENIQMMILMMKEIMKGEEIDIEEFIEIILVDLQVKVGVGVEVEVGVKAIIEI